MSEAIGLPGEMPVDQNRRLIGADYTSDDQLAGIREFSYHGQRILELPAKGHDFALHERLVSRHIPVFPVASVAGEHAYILVPGEARTVQQSLRFIARDIEAYKPIFGSVGSLLGKCESNGLGLPHQLHTRGILRSMAFSIDTGDDDFGGGVRLFPPYVLSAEATKTETLHRIRQELLASSYLSGPAADELIRTAAKEWSGVR